MEENKIETQVKKKQNQKILIAILATLFLATGLAVGILLVKQNQQIKEKAATPTGTVKVFLSPETKTVEVGQTFSVNILLDTAGKNISAITLDLSYPYNGDIPPIAATDVQVSSNLVVNSNWNFPIKSVNTEEKLVQVRIGGLNSSSEGYKTNGEEVIATINFKAQAAGSINLAFNPTTTKVTDKTTGEDILLTPSSSGSYLAQESESNNTPTPSSTSSTNTPVATPTKTGTPVPVAKPSSSPIPAPQSGVSFPTLVGIGSGVILIISAFALVL